MQRQGDTFRPWIKSAGLEGILLDCKINVIVPSDSMLSRSHSMYLDDAKEPGVKNAIDGKKLVSGLRVMGDEHLCGYEMAPTLSERKATLVSALQIVDNLRTVVEEKSVDGCASVCELENSMNMKEAILLTISHLSSRIRELQELVVKKNMALNNLLKQVEGDWKNSKVAPAISCYKTKIVHSTTTIRDLLQSVDNLGYIVACINGTEKDYVHGNQANIHK
jgi:hypothetical protein